MEDGEILALFEARSECALEELSGKYGKLCGQVAENILKNRSDAEECVNDALLASWNTIPPQRPNPLKTYVLRLVRNLAVTRYHRNTAQKRNSFYDAALDELAECLAAPEDAEDRLTAGELTALLDRFLNTLKADDRVLFVRRYWYGDSVAHAAKRVGLRPGSASVRLSRLRDKLRIILHKEGYWV